MSELLISVRSADEAVIALDAGADLIDVKEPERGSLGRANHEVIQDVLQIVDGKRPVSAAWGELLDEAQPHPNINQLTYVKFGLSGCRDVPDWRDRMPHSETNPQWVYVAYADAEPANAPDVDEILAEACCHPGSVFLIDTFNKNRGILLDWLPPDRLLQITQACRHHQVSLALAGSLGIDSMEMLLTLGVCPRWFAVRGAVCEKWDRQASLCPKRARELCHWLSERAPQPDAPARD